MARLTSAVEAAREERRAAVADALEAEKEVTSNHIASMTCLKRPSNASLEK